MVVALAQPQSRANTPIAMPERIKSLTSLLDARVPTILGNATRSYPIDIHTATQLKRLSIRGFQVLVVPRNNLIIAIVYRFALVDYKPRILK